MNTKVAKIIGALLSIAALFLPVVSIASFLGERSIYGYASDLVLTAGIGCLIALLAFSKSKVANVFCVLAALVGIWVTGAMMVRAFGLLDTTSELVYSVIGGAGPVALLGMIIVLAASFARPAESNREVADQWKRILKK